MNSSTRFSTIRCLLTGSLLAVSALSLCSQAHARGFKMVQLSADQQQPELHSAQTNTQARQLDDVINRCVQLTLAAPANDEAQTACHQAVIEAQHNSGRGVSNRALKAYAYNNRGVQKLQHSDRTGALADFQAAVALKADAITEHNLQLLSRQLNKPD